MKAISLAKNANYAVLDSTTQVAIPVLFLEWDKPKSNSQRKSLKLKEKNLVEYIKIRAGFDKVKVAHE